MHSGDRNIETIARLFRYPDEDYLLDLDRIPARLENESAEAARLLRGFRDRVGTLSTEGLQELYTRTFDLNPVCALEVGWQLYGEEYSRGGFLVFMRAALRRHGVPETTELPDHLVHALPLLDRLSEDEARDLAEGAVLPALGKMLTAFAKKNSPYELVLQAAKELLQASFARNSMEASHA